MSCKIPDDLSSSQAVLSVHDERAARPASRHVVLRPGRLGQVEQVDRLDGPPDVRQLRVGGEERDEVLDTHADAVVGNSSSSSFFRQTSFF